MLVSQAQRLHAAELTPLSLFMLLIIDWSIAKNLVDFEGIVSIKRSSCMVDQARGMVQENSERVLELISC